MGRMSAPDAAHLRAELAERVELLLEEQKAGAEFLYLWGGAKSLEEGVDCSGFLCVLARGLSTPLPLGRPDTDALWRELEPVAKPEPGDLALYGTGDLADPASHVMVVLEGGRVAGMSGGGRKTRTKEIARKFGARLKAFDSPRYRGDLIGFRRLPFHLAPGVAPA